MKMLKWMSCRDPKTIAAEFILGNKSKEMNLEDALLLFRKKVKEGHPRTVRGFAQKVLLRLLPNKSINSFTVGDLEKLVLAVQKEGYGDTEAYSIRSYFANVLRAINDVPVQKLPRNAPKPGENITHDGPRKFRLKLFDLSELPSLGIGKSPSKHESFVNEVINSLLDISPGKSYLIEPLKGDVLTVKEIRGYKMHTNKTFRERKMNWQLGYSESHKCFAVFPAEQPTPKGATNHAK